MDGQAMSEKLEPMTIPEMREFYDGADRYVPLNRASADVQCLIYLLEISKNMLKKKDEEIRLLKAENAGLWRQIIEEQV